MKSPQYNISARIRSISMVCVCALIVSCTSSSTTDPTPQPGMALDICGNSYHVVTIGSQTWFAENLRTTKYRNGENIDFDPDTMTWGGGLEGKYCYPNDSKQNVSDYGLLYDYYAVNGSRPIAPAGWHIPVDSDWKRLFTYLGGDTIAAAALKETGTNHWNPPNVADNGSGFAALPAGYRFFNGYYFDIRKTCFFWCANGKADSLAYNVRMAYNAKQVGRPYYGLGYGFSVRCIKDN